MYWPLHILLIGAGISPLIQLLSKYSLGNRYQKVLSIMSGLYLFYLSVFHILPEIWELKSGRQWITFFVVVGVLLPIVLKLFNNNKGIEGKSATYIFVAYIAICIHSFFDGVMLTDVFSLAHDHHHHAAHDSLFVGIVIHKIPAAFSLFYILKIIKNKSLFLSFYMFLFALTAPLGYALSSILVDGGIIDYKLVIYAQSFVLGSFISFIFLLFHFFITQKKK